MELKDTLIIIQIVLTIIIIPWIKWVTSKIFKIEKDIAINKVHFDVLVEKIEEITKRLDKLIEIQREHK